MRGTQSVLFDAVALFRDSCFACFVVGLFVRFFLLSLRFLGSSSFMCRFAEAADRRDREWPCGAQTPVLLTQVGPLVGCSVLLERGRVAWQRGSFVVGRSFS